VESKPDERKRHFRSLVEESLTSGKLSEFCPPPLFGGLQECDERKLDKLTHHTSLPLNWLSRLEQVAVRAAGCKVQVAQREEVL